MKKGSINKIILTLLIFVFLVILSLVLFLEVNFIDEKFYSFFGNFINEKNTEIFKVFTFFGSTLAIIILSLLSIVFVRKHALYICLNPLIAVTISQTLKYTVGRTRPNGINLIEEDGFSFPSGHSLVSMAFYGFLIYLVYKSNLKNTTKNIIITAISLLILLIGLSRIYLGVHYTTDVIAGFIVGIVHLYLYINLIFEKKKK